MAHEQYIKTVPQAALSNNSGTLITNAGGALGLILLLILAIAWAVRRTGLAPGSVKNGKHLSIIESRSLGQRERAVIIEVENKWLVLGVTSSQVTCLATLDKPNQIASEDVLQEKDPFQSTLMKVLKKSKAGSVK